MPTFKDRVRKWLGLQSNTVSSGGTVRHRIQIVDEPIIPPRKNNLQKAPDHYNRNKTKDSYDSTRISSYEPIETTVSHINFNTIYTS